MHENAGEVKLDLKSDIDVGAVDSWRPPQSETTVWNLIETRTLSVGQLLIFHRLFKAAGFLPVSETLQCCNFKKILHSAQCRPMAKSEATVKKLP